MPNHVRNVLKFKKLKSDDIDFILNTIATDSEGDAEGVYPAGKIIDFDRIIPEPKEESECPDEFKVNKDSHISPDAERPWFDWYRWRIHYWDTKWGAYDCYTIIGKSYIIFVFSTAWSMAYPVMEKLQLLGYEFELKYADEDYGANCGRLTYSSEQGLNRYDESSFKKPSQWARDLWNRY